MGDIKRIGKIGKLARWCADAAYYYSALWCPTFIPGWVTYAFRARFYFEQRTESSWPWAWNAFEDGHMLVSDFGKELGVYQESQK